MSNLLTKLKIKPPHRFLCLRAPADFQAKITSGNAGCTFTEQTDQPFDSIHWFVKNQAELDADFPKVLALLQPGLPVWVYYPKGSSGIQTDLTRDAGWETLMNNPDIRWISMIAFDATWTTFCFRLKTDQDRAEEARPKEERAIFQYADPVTKTITLPEDLKNMLAAYPSEQAIFEALSYSNRREYVEWVITAKQAQTRQARLEGCIDRLRKGWKNPAGR